jgi:hypothetical protein
MSPPTIAEKMAAYAQDAVDFARINFQVELDYSLDSVRRLDQILENQHRDIPVGWRKLIRRGPSKVRLVMLANIWGGYLGEVLKRKWTGEWLIPADGPFKGAAALVVAGRTLSPPTRAHKRLVNGEEASLWTYVAALQHMLSQDKRET